MNNDRQENVRIAYQVAVDLLKSEEEGIWARFNVMLVANSIAVAAISLGLTSENKLPILTIGLPFFGVFLCVMWIFLIERGFAFRKYFVLSARELEVRLPHYVKILSRGKKFADGQEVMFHLPYVSPNESPYQMSFRWLKPKRIAYLVIMAFIILYLSIILIQCPALFYNIPFLRKLHIIHFLMSSSDNCIIKNCV